MVTRLSVIFLGILYLLGIPDSVAAFFWNNNQELVTINGKISTTEDYKNWWKEWREKDAPVPDTLDEYINWMLLYQEAQAMQLDQNAEYQKKISIFLKVRALMQLKQDEIISRTKMPDQKTLWQNYIKEYTPLFNLRLAAVNSEEHAAVIQRLLNEGIPLADAVTKAGLAKIAEQFNATGLMRASKIPEPIYKEVGKVAVGKCGGPVFYGHVWYFFEILEREDGSEEDFNKVKDQLIRQALKIQESELTRELIRSLSKKYQVFVDKTLISSITAEGYPAEIATKTVLKVGNSEVSADALYQTVVKEQKTRGGAHRNAQTFEETKQRIIADAIAQTITGLEALDRHYENSFPLKPIFEFYCQHRMIKELEKTVVSSGIKVTAADAEVYYNEHPELFSKEGLVELAVVQTTETALAEKLAKQLKNGENFFTVMQPLAPSGIETQRTPIEHLQPVIQKALAIMSPGQVSGALKDGKDIYFVKLIQTGAREIIPLEKVSEQISTELREKKFATAKNKIIRQLRERSTIKVNDGEWNKLRKVLIEEGEAAHGS